MGDARNKAKKLAEEQAIRDAERCRREGWTIFYFDFDPKRTRRNLSPGHALRYLLKVTQTRVSWWRCPIRGWAIQYHKLPVTTKMYDSGETYRMLHFSNLENEIEAKKILGEDLLLSGIELYRGLPNKTFDEQVNVIRWLLTAPPSVTAEEWLKQKEQLSARTQRILRTHESALRLHLLRENYTGKPDSPVKLTVESRLRELELSSR
jgi:hypothetical protein